SPLPWAPEGLTEEVLEKVARPTIAELAGGDIPLVGILYCGLALTSRGLRVVEFNARFGDPDTQVVPERLTSPSAPLLLSAARGDPAGERERGRRGDRRGRLRRVPGLRPLRRPDHRDRRLRAAGRARHPRRHRPRGRRPGQRRGPRAVRRRHRDGPRAGPRAGPRRDRGGRPRRQPPPHRHRPPRRGRGTRHRARRGGERRSTATAPLIEAPQLPGWDHVVSGKVRELYVPAGVAPSRAEEVLVVATDRISAYDHSLQPGIPDKGRLLTGISRFWFA